MKPDTSHFSEIAPDTATLEISAREVSRLAKSPLDRWEDAVSSAIREARPLLHARARWLRLEDAAMEGLFPTETPVEPICRGAKRWAFVATIGPLLEARVQEHFDEKLFLEAVLLDAAGSVAVEAVCDLAENASAQGGVAPPETSSQRFSPGYCAWSMQAQTRLFAMLKPEDLAIKLLPSMLMNPLKSVSGIIVRAPASALRVPAQVCEQCVAKGCSRRQARYVANGPAKAAR